MRKEYAMELAKVGIEDIRLGSHQRKYQGDLDALAQSLKEHGLAEPIGLVKKTNELIFGSRRLAAAKKNGWTTIDAIIIDVDDVQKMILERVENEHRLDFAPSEKVALARKIEEALKGRKGGKKKKQNGDDPNAGTPTRDVAANGAGFTSTTLYRQAAEVVDRGADKLVELMDTGKVTVDVAAEAAALKPKAQAAFVAQVEQGVSPRKALKDVAPAPTPRKKDGAAGKSNGQAPAPASTPTLKDGLGQTVPDCQKDAFNDPALPESITQLQAWVTETAWEPLVRRLTEKQHALPYLDVATLARHLGEMETALALSLETLKHGVPYAVCARCQGEGKNEDGPCPDCRGGGHLASWRHGELFGKAEAV